VVVIIQSSRLLKAQSSKAGGMDKLACLCVSARRQVCPCPTAQAERCKIENQDAQVLFPFSFNAELFVIFPNSTIRLFNDVRFNCFVISGEQLHKKGGYDGKAEKTI
jgi:hypothetical protein